MADDITVEILEGIHEEIRKTNERLESFRVQTNESLHNLRVDMNDNFRRLRNEMLERDADLELRWATRMVQLTAATRCT